MKKNNRMKKIIIFCLSIIFIFCSFGCNENSSNSSSSQNFIETTLSYYDVSQDELTLEQQQEIDSLLYQNTLDTTISPVTADPSVIYCEEDGYYYMYGTFDHGTIRAITCFRSRTLTEWEQLDHAFYQPNQLSYDKVSDIMTESEHAEYQNGSWIKNGNLWAPSVMYDADLGKYLMFSSAQTSSRTDADLSENYALFLAVSDHPSGPFIQWTGTNYNGEEISLSSLYLNFKNLTDTLGNEYEDIDAIDAEPFVDPVTQDKYLFFVGARGKHMDTNNIFGVKMIDWFTADLSTLTLLAVPNFRKVTDLAKTFSDEGDINEGPAVVYNQENGLYYMTFSANGFVYKTYCVKQAVATSPLGPYEKVFNNKGGRVISCESDWLHRSGTGHHTFITVGEETFIVYPMHSNLQSTSLKWKARCIGFDRVTWVENQDGLLVLSSNGPSYDYKLRPDTVTGYTNLAPLATVTCNNSQNGSSVSALTDGTGQMLINQGIFDYNANKEPLVITLDFSNPITLKGVMVTNSRDLERAFEKISKIEVEYTDGNQWYRGSTGEIIFDWERFYTNNKTADGFSMLIPGCSSTAIFEEISNVSKIKIYLENQIWDSVMGLSVAEVAVIGK